MTDVRTLRDFEQLVYQNLRYPRTAPHSSKKNSGHALSASIAIHPFRTPWHAGKSTKSRHRQIRKGDVIWIPAGTKHWHGATQTGSMTHIAITEQLDGNAVTWMEE
jgi:hypothetical protein